MAWRLARFILANPVNSARGVIDAADLSVAPETKAAAEISSLSHPDIALLRREVNEKTGRFYTEIRADDVRRAIGLFQRGAGAGGYRICLIDSAEDLNRSSANALLKLIEEPPPLSLFLLIAHRPGFVLPTIRSRSRMMRLQALGAKGVATLGPPWTDMPASDIAAAAEQARGSVRDTLGILGNRGPGLGRTVVRVLDSLPALDWREIHKLADQVSGRQGEAAYATIVTAILDWIAGTIRSGAGSAPRSLAPLAEAWDKMAAQTREAEALNLDKRSLVVSLFVDLAVAVRAASG